ncbi:hypothetical protein GLX27_003091 [Malassezia furfur]|uniref:Uncharacterized protein n=1 Tax=Malassezia furfur TaxID=55194 RepID=A0ABY8ES81_MALFU|nr:hypothetical protein GLX27_003091 [Malassezia furfur]
MPNSLGLSVAEPREPPREPPTASTPPASDAFLQHTPSVGDASQASDKELDTTGDRIQDAQVEAVSDQLPNMAHTSPRMSVPTSPVPTRERPLSPPTTSLGMTSRAEAMQRLAQTDGSRRRSTSTWRSTSSEPEKESGTWRQPMWLDRLANRQASMPVPEAERGASEQRRTSFMQVFPRPSLASFRPRSSLNRKESTSDARSTHASEAAVSPAPTETSVAAPAAPVAAPVAAPAAPAAPVVAPAAAPAAAPTAPAAPAAPVAAPAAPVAAPVAAPAAAPVMPPPAAPTTASEAIPSRPGSTLAGQFQRAPRSAAPTAEASATHAAPPTPQKDARWRRPSAGTTLDDTASTASVSATSAPTSAPTSVPTPAPTAPMPAAKASSARKTAPKSPPAPVSPGPAFLGAPSPRVASGSAEAPVAAPVAAPAPAAAPLPTRAPTVSHRVETPSKPTGASYPRSASVDVSPAPALIPSSPAAPAAPLAWTQRLPSVAPRTPSASRYASQSSGDDSLMHKFMHEIADELDSLDAIGGSFAVTSWPTPGQKSAAAAAASETAPTAAAELDTPSIRVGSGVWADPRAEERAAEAERAAEEARAAEAARAAKAARAAEEARAAEAARAEAARAAEDRAPSRTAHQFDDADEDALLLEKLPASRAETPVYAAFARSAHEHRLQPRASLRGTPPPRPLGARDMPRAPSADSEKQRKVRARMSVPAMRPDERPASIVAGPGAAPVRERPASVLGVGSVPALGEPVAARASMEAPFAPRASVDAPAAARASIDVPVAPRASVEVPAAAAPPRAPLVSSTAPRAPLVSSTAPRAPLVSSTAPRAPLVSSTAPRAPVVSSTAPRASAGAAVGTTSPYTSPMLTSSPYASPRVGAPASPRVDAPASPAIGGAPAAIGTTVVPTQMRPASVAGMAGPAVRPVSGPGTAGPTMRPASVAGMTSPAMRPASAAATVRPGVARAASLGAASPTVGVRPASVAATRMPGSPVPGSPVPGAARASPLADATNRDKPTGLSAAAAAAQLKHRRSLLGAFRKDDAKPDAARARVPSGSSEKENAAARPMSPAGDAVGARHSWFNGLLHRRQTQMLMSVQNLTTTVEGCQALLRQLGATLTPLSRAQSTLPTTQQGPLQYAVDQIYDHTEGAVTACRPMRFRVEYTILPVSSQTRRVSGPVPTSHAPGMPGFDPRAASRPMSPAFRTPSTETTYATSVTFSHEKGSSTTFRTFMAKLRRDWHLDARDAM